LVICGEAGHGIQTVKVLLTHYLKEHDPYDRLAAFEQAVQTEKLPLGIFYKHPGKETFEEGIKAYEVDKRPIIERISDRQRLAQLIKAKR